MAVTRSHLSKQRSGTIVTPKKVSPHTLLNIVRNRPGAAISKQPRASQRTRRPSAQLQEELENAICRAASAKEREEEAPRFLFVPFPDVKDIAEETHIAIDASNISNRFLARYPMYNARNMAMIQRELGKGFASHGMTSTKPYCKIPILHQGVVTMQHLSHSFNRDVTFRSWKWLQDQLDNVSSRPKFRSVSKPHNETIRKPASHPRKTQQDGLLTDTNTPYIIYLHWTIDPGPPTADLALIHAQISALQTLHPHKTIRAFPSLSETTSEILKIPDILTLDAIASTSPWEYAYRPTTCFTHASPNHNMSTCPLRGQKRIIMKRTHSCSGSHVELISGNAALPRHHTPPFTTTTTTTTKTKQQQPPPPQSPIYFAQSYEPSFSQHGEYRIFITTFPSTSPAAIRGREGRILHTVITEWVDRQDPGEMYARVATAQDFHVHAHAHPKSHSHHSQSRSHHSHPHTHSQHKSSASATVSLTSLHTYALYIYTRLRCCQEWKEQFESLEMGVRLDVGVGIPTRRRRTKDDDRNDEDEDDAKNDDDDDDAKTKGGGEKEEEEDEKEEENGVIKKGKNRRLEKRFFVNEITRFYGADYFSQHTLGAPQQEVCWGFAEAVGEYFAGR